MSSPTSSVIGGITGITGIASALGSDDKTIKTIGVADSGVQVAGATLVQFAPGAGTVLNAANSIGGKLIGTPEEIKNFFDMSKKAFKRAVGSLLKKGLIEKTEKGFKVKE